MLLYDINSSQEKRFNPTPSDCQLVVSLLESNFESSQKRDFMAPFYPSEAADVTTTTGFMPVILLPPVSQCCGHNLLIRNRPSQARVYTSHGTEIAALFTGECKSCHQKYQYSFSERPGNGELVSERSYFYGPDQEYFQLSSKSVFSIEFLHEVGLNLEISWVSFESRAKVYNERFKKSDAAKFQLISHQFKLPGPESEQPWVLNHQRLEEAWFLQKIVEYYSQSGKLSSAKFPGKYFSSGGTSSHRLDIEGLCSKAWEDIVADQNSWIHHTCDVTGCKEGYVTIDGLEKVSRTICAAPREKLKLPPGLPNIVQCCHNSPVMGGKHVHASKFCSQHQKELESKSNTDNSVKDLPTTSLAQHQGLTNSVIGNLPDNDSPALLAGCKKQINRYHNRTAGILAAVRPCGVVVNFTEMYTCESPTQAYVFLWLTFGRCVEDLKRLKYCGYDRACDLHPFIKRMRREGGLGAKILDDHVQFVVDKFHCINHTEPCCMPPENPACCYHPDLPKFKEIHGTNTECAEQAFNWLGRYKTVTRSMSQFKFNFFLWKMINGHNSRLYKS